MTKYSLKQFLLFFIVLFIGINKGHAESNDMIIRIAEIEVYPEFLEEYKEILKYEAEASVRLEEGVVAIFPMFRKSNPTSVCILEMYKNEEAYQFHLQTEHFLKYKSTTLHMIKLLELIDMNAMDLEAATSIFNKL